jgi:hypothetical protein
MAKCANCGKSYTCGCQKRKASDGKLVCASCITNYEVQKKQKTLKPLSK